MQQVNSREEVEQALNIVLQDAKFAAAPQMSAFLKFVVMQTLDGKADRIKAYTVAVDALGKPATFDPQNDPSVRVLAKRLRDTLSAYYERTQGHTVFLRLRCGSYIPKFESANSIEATGERIDQTFSNASNVTPITRNTAVSDTHNANVDSSEAIYGNSKLAKP